MCVPASIFFGCREGMLLNRGTGFYFPRAVGTLTIPSTAGKVISVGAYDSRLNAYADFSGRGSQYLPSSETGSGWHRVLILQHRFPEAAMQPSLELLLRHRLSAAAQRFLMEWGIVRENDPYLYGEKVKAYLRRGARAVAWD